jgi:hypothetical protein
MYTHMYYTRTCSFLYYYVYIIIPCLFTSAVLMHFYFVSARL